MRATKPMLSSRASSSINPCSTAIPAARSLAKPSPATRGFGSCIAATHVLDAGIDDRVHAGRSAAVMAARFQVHVQRLRRASAPRPLLVPAPPRAASRPFHAQPVPTTAPSLTMTQPTRGLGVVVYRPRPASSSACPMNSWLAAASITSRYGAHAWCRASSPRVSRRGSRPRAENPRTPKQKRM